MKYDPHRHHRRSIRRIGYDYSTVGAYFVTICVHHRAPLLGTILHRTMRLTAAGRMVLAEWSRLADRFPMVALDAFVVMPDHIHGIIVIADVAPAIGDSASTIASPIEPPTTNDTVGATLVVAPIHVAPHIAPQIAPHIAPHVPPQIAPDIAPHAARSPTVGDIVGAFKSRTTMRYTHGVKQSEWPMFYRRLWQRNYFERIIRDERALRQIRKYIVARPAHWEPPKGQPITCRF